MSINDSPKRKKRSYPPFWDKFIPVALGHRLFDLYNDKSCPGNGSPAVLIANISRSLTT